MPVATLYGNFRAVMRYLTNNYQTDLEKLRSLFVWVTSINAKQIEHCLQRLPARNTPLEAILRIHWKMGDYAHFFVQLCR
jgi:transglutaminase-like putative cysteine protease